MVVKSSPPKRSPAVGCHPWATETWKRSGKCTPQHRCFAGLNRRHRHRLRHMRLDTQGVCQDSGRRSAIRRRCRSVRSESPRYLRILDGNPARDPPGEAAVRVTYHEPCHLVRGQNVSKQPRDILKMNPGLEFVEMNEAKWCCGSAGTQIITHYHNSMALLAQGQNVADNRAEVVTAVSWLSVAVVSAPNARNWTSASPIPCSFWPRPTATSAIRDMPRKRTTAHDRRGSYRRRVNTQHVSDRRTHAQHSAHRLSLIEEMLTHV